MTDHFWLGMFVIFVSGILNGSFPPPMKYSRRWRWENTWLAFSVIGIFALPWVLAATFVPHLGEVYQSVPVRALLPPLIFGFLWGIAQVTYGLSIDAVGMAIATAVVGGLGCLAGALVPLLVLSPADLWRPRGVLLLSSMPILFAGLALYGVAGRRRERERSATQVAASSTPIVRSFAAGLAIAIFTGIFASNFNLGFAFSGELQRKTFTLGAGSLTGTYAVWALVFGAGSIPNLLYCFFLLVRRRTLRLFLQSGWPKETLLSAAMAALWIAGVFGYGMGATLVGKYGTSVGFTLFMATSILASNGGGILAGEWQATSPRTKTLLTAGMIVIVVSVCVLNLGGLF